jgi:hypothetical protein
MKAKGPQAARSATRSSKKPKLYRPSRAFPFPEVGGETVVDVYVIAENDRNCVTLRFDDNTELVIEIEPCLSFTADYSNWKTGNAHPIKSWTRRP